MLVTDLAGFGFVAPPVDTALDSYNRADPFDIYSAGSREAFWLNLANFDAYDNQPDWDADAAANQWGSIGCRTSNYLVVDTSKPCSLRFAAHLPRDRARTADGREHETCGGRMPNEDALDVTLNFLIRGPSATAEDDGAVRDGVDQATKPSSATFPYLAEICATEPMSVNDAVVT